MKVLLLCDKFPPYHSGGAEIYAYRISQKLKDYGHEVSVFGGGVVRRPCFDINEEITDDIKIFRYNSCYPDIPFFNLTKEFVDPFAIRQVRTVLKKINPDIVHVHIFHKGLSFLSVIAAKQFKIPTILTAHDYWLICPKYILLDQKSQICTKKECFKCLRGKYIPFRSKLVKYFSKYIDLFITPSRTMKAYFVQHGFPKNRILAIHNGIEFDTKTSNASLKEFRRKYYIQDDDKVILFVGRHKPYKGLDRLIRAVTYLKVEKFKVLIVGSEVKLYDNYVRKLAEKHNILSKLIFTGDIREEDVWTAYKISDVCAVPSLHPEPFGLVVIEAMWAGVPVIGTIFGGPSEIIQDGKTGFLADPRNAREFGSKINMLLTNKDMHKQMRINATQVARQNFSMDLHVQKLLKVYLHFQKNRN